MSEQEVGNAEAFLEQCIQAAVRSMQIDVAKMSTTSAGCWGSLRIATRVIQQGCRRTNFDEYDPRLGGAVIPVDKPPTQSAE